MEQFCLQGFAMPPLWQPAWVPVPNINMMSLLESDTQFEKDPIGRTGYPRWWYCWLLTFNSQFLWFLHRGGSALAEKHKNSRLTGLCASLAVQWNSWREKFKAKPLHLQLEEKQNNIFCCDLWLLKMSNFLLDHLFHNIVIKAACRKDKWHMCIVLLFWFSNIWINVGCIAV